MASVLPAQQLPLGEIAGDVRCAADASQSYALYLPSNYTAERAWPVIFAFDPGGRGQRGVEQYRAAAEKFGYIVAGSNVSRNGSWNVSMGAAQAMGADVSSRFRIDERRVYTAGMSGGARVALGVALAAPQMVAGVVASSAGYPDSKPRKTLPFAVFGTAGTEDFNWIEMRLMDHALTSPHRLHVFEGGHVWLPSEVAVEAVEWLDLQAMKTGRLARDAARLTEMYARRHAAALASSGEWERCRLLEALAADFAGLREVDDIVRQAAALRRGKAAKDAAKAETAEEQTERRMLSDILDWEQQLRADGQRAEAFARLREQWKRMNAAGAGAADTAERRIARRVMRGLSMGASDRTQDAEYLRLLGTYRPAHMGAR